MDKENLLKYRELLLKEKEDFIRQKSIIEHGRNDNEMGLDSSLLDSVGELSSYDNHPADHADITFERSKDIGLRDNINSLLSMLDDALEKIEQGTYGICDHCGQPIPEERLDAFPYTTMCIECKSNLERFEEPRERPLEEEILSPPYARTFTDGTDQIGFDGEDSWQKVARYGTSNSPQDITGAITYEDTFYDADEKQGEVDWGDGIIDDGAKNDGITEEYAEDMNTGNLRRRSRAEYRFPKKELLD